MKKTPFPSFILTKPGVIDWKLLIFLLLFLNVKLLIKLAALIIIYVLRPDFKFGFRFSGSRLPLFYVLIIGTGIITWLFSGLISDLNYDIVLATGILFWVLCILAIHQIKLAVEINDPQVIYHTIVVFFILNALVSLAVYAGIVWETGAINPYRYQGNFQKYFIGTGDYIKGISFDTSTTNAVLNAFGVIYFLLRGKYLLTILCMAVLLLTGSNISNLLLCAVLVFVFFFQSNKDQKSMIVVCLVMLIVFFVKISPQNNQYVANAYQKLFNKEPDRKTVTTNIPITERPDSSLTSEERKQKIAQLYMDSINISVFEKNKKKVLVGLAPMSIAGFTEKPEIPKDSIHTPAFQHKNDTNAIEKNLLLFVEKNNVQVPISAGLETRSKLPGKLVALQQTSRYFMEHPGKLIAGTGIGNFSSKLAFRATSMKVTGSYPEKYSYINEDFKSNHLDLYVYYFSNKDGYHSIINSPNSAYDQLMAEYGLMGILSFAFFYVAFFAKHLSKRAYAIPLFLFFLGALFIEYWFEQLSIVIFFELLLLLNIKEITVNKNHEIN